jgi:polyvinyl alcohol dehydrogenase (cytochrome)
VKILISLRVIGLSTVTVLLAACGSTGHSPSEGQTSSAQAVGSDPQLDCGADESWPMFGQNLCNTRSASNMGPLNKNTASKLAVKWKFQAAGDISATPAVVGGDVYVPDWGGMLNKINVGTGKADWSVSIGALIAGSDAGPGPNDTPAPIIARDTPVVTNDSVIFGVGSTGFPKSLAIVAAVDRTTGALKWQTQVEAHPSAVITSSPVLDRGKVYVGVASVEEYLAALPLRNPPVPYTCCSFRGSVVALDAGTGKILWKTYTIEDSAYFNSDGKTPSGYSGVGVWSTPTVDRGRNSLFITTGNNYSQPQGAGALPPGDHVESILSLDMGTGAIKWSQRMTPGDVWNYYILFTQGPSGGGPDWDFGIGANLFQTSLNGVQRDILGAGQKSGIYWAVDPDSGNVLWNQQVGPGGHLGGIHWGTAVDGKHVYVGVNDEAGSPYTIGGTGPQAGQQTSVGSWAALNPSTGDIQWQVANPTMTAPVNLVSVNGPVSAANGVMFGGSMDTKGTMFAFDGDTGAVLWSFASGATVYGGPAIADGVVYWGNGYPYSRIQFGTPGGTLYAFQVTP